MGLFSRVGSIGRAILNTFVSGLEDKYVIELAESQLQQATERLREGRQGLVSYQALVLNVQQQADEGRRRVTRLTAEIKAHLKAGNEDVAAQLALELSQVKQDVAANEEQLTLHRQAYDNSLLKMKSALKDIEKAKNDLEKRKAALKMERALAEVSEAAGALNASVDVSTDFGSIMGKLERGPRKKPVKFYYATQTGVRPPTFLVFCTDPAAVQTSYRRFLENRLREDFDLRGTPIRLRLRARRAE